MKTNTVTVLIGPPGCGKSTWTNKLIVNRPVSHLYPLVVASTDNLLMRRAQELGLANYDEAWKQLGLKEAEKEFKEVLKSAVTLSWDVVVDRTNMSRSSRAKVLDFFPDTYKKVAVVFDFSDRSEIEDRLEKRRLAEGKTIPKFVLDDMIKRFEEPTLGEFDEIIKA